MRGRKLVTRERYPDLGSTDQLSDKRREKQTKHHKEITGIDPVVSPRDPNKELLLCLTDTWRPVFSGFCHVFPIASLCTEKFLNADLPMQEG